MMKLSTCILSLVFVIHGYGQCNLNMNDAPVIRGFKLGMSKADVTALVGPPLETFRPAADDWTYGSELQKLTNFHNIGFVSLHFFEAKLYEFEIEYSLDIKWENAQEFATNISKNLGLPVTEWKHDTESDTTLSLVCNGFSVNLRSRPFSNIGVADLAAQMKRFKAEKAKEAQQKKVFKP